MAIGWQQAPLNAISQQEDEATQRDMADSRPGQEMYKISQGFLLFPESRAKTSGHWVLVEELEVQAEEAPTA